MIIHSDIFIIICLFWHSYYIIISTQPVQFRKNTSEDIKIDKETFMYKPFSGKY